MGRERDRQWLAASIERGPISVVWGAPESGKTAVVLQVLTQSFAARVPRVVFVPGEEAADVALSAARALALALHVRGVDWTAVLGEPDARIATALDLAEEGDAWVVLDGVIGEAESVEKTLMALARYVRRSRWIVTMRRDPSLVGFDEQCRELEPMATADIELLAARIAPDTDEPIRVRIARSAQGSPGRLRALLRRASASDPAHDGDARALLAASEHPAAALGALRSFLAARDNASACETVARHGRELLELGYALELWQMLGPMDPRSDVLESFRLEVAAAIGNAEAVRLARLPARATARDRLLWAKLALESGDLRAALPSAEAAEADARSTNDPETAFEAVMLRARVLANLGRGREQLDVLTSAEPPDAEGGARRDVRVAQAALSLADFSRAESMAAEIATRLHRLPPHTSRDVGYGLARIFYALGDLYRASEILHGVEPASPREAGAEAQYSGRQRLAFRAAIANDRGELAECRMLLDRLRPFVGNASLQRPFFDYIDVQLAAASGELAGLATRLDALIGEARAGESSLHFHAALLYRSRLAVRLGEPYDPERWSVPPNIGSPPAPLGELLSSALAIHAVRSGLDVNEDDGREGESHLVEVRLVAGMQRATAALVRADTTRAVEEALATASLARTRGYALLEAEARLLVCEALLAGERRAELATALAELEALASKFPSPFLLDEARCLAFGTLPMAPLPTDLEDLAARPDARPAARRARALLGGAPALDAVDRRVVAALTATAGGFLVRTLSNTASTGSGWGLDEVRKEVWLPGGRRVPLGTRAQLFVLAAALFESGSATKERLVEVVWHERSYHPLRHDNRLQAAIRQLRHAVEDDPKTPLRVVTTPDGYALGAREPGRRLIRRGGP